MNAFKIKRPRVTRNGTFDPKESKDYKSFVRLVVSQVAPETLITEVIKMSIYGSQKSITISRKWL